ncbi:MAG TPA: hypothetical protein VIY73_12055, partial [Polyangiaceae bacterium]
MRWYGHPFPGVLVTPDACVSSIGMPDWSGLEQGLRFPDRFETIDGVSLAGRGELPGRAWDRAVDAAFAADRASV